MERIVERGCGLDVHKKSVAACLRVPGANGQRLQEVRTFGTTAAELLALRDWLEGHRVTRVAMESTGVYWKPIFYVLEKALTCVLVHPVHMRQGPGRKTDMQDCVWIAQLLEHGLLRGSFVPPVPIREPRDLTRYRRTMVQERSHAINRLHKVLMDRQSYDLQLTKYADRGWRATFYTSGMEHVPTASTGSAWDRTPWRAVQRAALETLKRAEAGRVACSRRGPVSTRPRLDVPNAHSRGRCSSSASSHGSNSVPQYDGMVSRQRSLSRLSNSAPTRITTTSSCVSTC